MSSSGVPFSVSPSFFAIDLAILPVRFGVVLSNPLFSNMVWDSFSCTYHCVRSLFFGSAKEDFLNMYCGTRSSIWCKMMSNTAVSMWEQVLALDKTGMESMDMAILTKYRASQKHERSKGKTKYDDSQGSTNVPWILFLEMNLPYLELNQHTASV